MKLKNKVSIYFASLIFLLLSLVMGALLLGYWWLVLEPRLIEEAKLHAQVVANAQASNLEKILAAKTTSDIPTQLNNELDNILRITEPATNVKLFKSIHLQLNKNLSTSPQLPHRLTRGEPACSNCISIKQALYFEPDDRMIGTVRFNLNSKIFLKLKSDLENKLFTEAMFMFLVLFVVWVGATQLIIRLNIQRENWEQAEKALKKHEQTYNRLLNNLNNYFTYKKNPQGEMIHMSNSVENVLGYQLEDIKLNFDKYCLDSEKYLAKVSQTVFGDEQLSYEMEIRASDNSIHTINLSEIAIRDEDNKIIEYEGIAHDVTEQKLYERQLSISKEEAELANKIKGQFLANMSHEIRTPLNAIIGLGQLLLNSKLNEKQLSQLKKINFSSHLLLNLVNEILDFSKVESDQIELEQVNFSIYELIENLQQMSMEKARQKDLRLIYKIDRAVPDNLIGDPLRLSQVFLNLVNNAIKFTQRGRVIINIQMNSMDNDICTLLCSVQDTGIGISPKQFDKLFKPFSQVDSSMTRQFGGTGLGLAICKKLVLIMHGEIWVESQLQVGSTFYFTVQLALSHNQASPIFEESSAGMEQISDSTDSDPIKNNVQPAERPRILLAEDNEINQEVALNILAEMDVDVVVVNDGLEALEKVKQEPFSLILMDLQMPVMDGFEATRLIKSMPEHRNIPIIAMTAHAMQGDRDKCLAMGMDDYLPKPIDIKVFTRTLKKWLNLN